MDWLVQGGHTAIADGRRGASRGKMKECETSSYFKKALSAKQSSDNVDTLKSGMKIVNHPLMSLYARRRKIVCMHCPTPLTAMLHNSNT